MRKLLFLFLLLLTVLLLVACGNDESSDKKSDDVNAESSEKSEAKNDKELEAEYLTQANHLVEDLPESMSKYKKVTFKAVEDTNFIKDEDWQKEKDDMLNEFETLIDDVKNLKPSSDLKEFNDELVNIVNEYDYLVDNYSETVEKMDKVSTDDKEDIFYDILQRLDKAEEHADKLKDIGKTS